MLEKLVADCETGQFHLLAEPWCVSRLAFPIQGFCPLLSFVPELTNVRMFFSEMLRRTPRWLVLIEALILVGSIGWIDYVTGWEWSFFIFYALPIAIVVRKAGRPLGFAFAVLCAVTWCVAQKDNNPYVTGSGFALAGASRLFYFCILVIAVAAVQDRRELDRARIKSLERAQELERQILRTSEREQQRIGRDLHDSLGPHLAAIGYAASFLMDELRGHDLPEAAAAERIRKMVSEAISLTRALARGIAPVQMDGPGLSMALEDLASTTSRLTGMSVSFSETGNTEVNDPECGIQIYRIAQEAVNNAAKHGGARNVGIVLSKSGGSLRLVVADDGKGMPPFQSGTRGMGLHSMRHRARSLGGELKIDSNPTEGTTVSCQIPLRPSGPASVPS